MSVQVAPHPVALTRKDVRRRLRVRWTTVNELVASGRLRSFRVNGAIRISEQALLDFMNAGQAPDRGPEPAVVRQD
jgi:excisionase family DNA binding protein